MPALETALTTDGVAEEIRRLTALGWVNVKDFGAVGDAATDDTAAIQAAIDWAYANGRQVIYMPSGQYRTTAPLYLDPPGNLRADLNDPTIFAFSLELRGVGGNSNWEGQGTYIRPDDNSFVALWVGPGQGMKVSGLMIFPDYDGIPSTGISTYPTTGTGIAISGGNGGTSRCDLDRVGVAYYYYGITAGTNHGALADSNRFYNVSVTDCHYGVSFISTQAYINDMIACNVTYCTIGVYSPVAKPVNVLGGNYSCSGAEQGVLTISNVSGLTEIPLADGSKWRFTAEVASPNAALTNLNYNVACLETDHYGLVPVHIVSFAAGVVTLDIDEGWHFGLFRQSTDLITETDIETDLQACTSLYCARRIIPFLGIGFNVQGVHIENPTAVTTLYFGSAGFTGSNVTILNDIMFNGSPDKSEIEGWSGYDSLLRNSKVWPFVSLRNPQNVILSNWSCLGGAIIETFTQGSCDVEISGMQLNWNYRLGNNTPNVEGYHQDQNTRARGFTRADRVQHYPVDYDPDMYPSISRRVGGPYSGYFPAPWSTPRLTPGQVDAATATPSYGAGPLLAGDTIYSVSNWDTGPQRYIFARNAAKMYTLGADQSINWTAQAGSPVVYMDNVDRMFPGLAIVLNDGSSDIGLVVTGVFKFLGYVTVTHLDNSSPTSAFPGTPGTNYSGSTVKQQPNRVLKYGRQCEFGTAAPTTGTWERGDIVYDTNVSASGFLGWVCVSGGTPGTWKTFGAVSS